MKNLSEIERVRNEDLEVFEVSKCIKKMPLGIPYHSPKLGAQNWRNGGVPHPTPWGGGYPSVRKSAAREGRWEGLGAWGERERELERERERLIPLTLLLPLASSSPFLSF